MLSMWGCSRSSQAAHVTLHAHENEDTEHHPQRILPLARAVEDDLSF